MLSLFPAFASAVEITGDTTTGDLYYSDSGTDLGRGADGGVGTIGTGQSVVRIAPGSSAAQTAAGLINSNYSEDGYSASVGYDAAVGTVNISQLLLQDNTPEQDHVAYHILGTYSGSGSYFFVQMVTVTASGLSGSMIDGSKDGTSPFYPNVGNGTVFNDDPDREKPLDSTLPANATGNPNVLTFKAYTFLATEYGENITLLDGFSWGFILTPAVKGVGSGSNSIHAAVEPAPEPTAFILCLAGLCAFVCKARSRAI